MSRHYARVAERADHRCEYCRAPEAIFNLPFDVEHIVPTSRDGPDDESNLALACRSCNLFKSDLTSGVDEVTGQVVRLYHPRHAVWTEHFRVEVEEGTVVGITPIGRVTASCLRMNRDVQRRARLAWTKLGLYP